MYFNSIYVCPFGSLKCCCDYVVNSCFVVEEGFRDSGNVDEFLMNTISFVAILICFSVSLQGSMLRLWSTKILASLFGMSEVRTRYRSFSVSSYELFDYYGFCMRSADVVTC